MRLQALLILVSFMVLGLRPSYGAAKVQVDGPHYFIRSNTLQSLTVASFYQHSSSGIAEKWGQSAVVVTSKMRCDRVMQQFHRHLNQLYLSPLSNPSYWHHTRLYKPHTLSIKYRRPVYRPILYSPSFVVNSLLPQTDTLRLYGSKRIDKSVFQETAVTRFEAMDERLLIAQPTLPRHQWDKIPSPHKFVLDGVLLDKKAAQEAFQITLVQSVKKLDKPKVEVSKWKVAGVESLQMSQSYFSNWVKGGQNAIAVNSDLRVTANYKDGKLEWDNKGMHKLGIINSDGEPLRINDDIIHLTTKAGINASKSWFYSAQYDFKTQFFYGRDKKNWDKILSGFMSPAYSSFALGMDYKRKDFTLLLSPLTSRTTIVLDTVNVNASRYNITPGKRSVSQTGASFTNNYRWRINTEFMLISNMDLFYGFWNEQPETQFDWELIFDMRINRFLSTRLNTTYKYYKSESDKLQFKENFSIVFSYKF
jgi:hypothetical protein